MGQNIIEIVAINFGTVMALMFLVWLLSIQCRDASLVDLAWGAGFAIISWMTVLQITSVGPRGLLLLTLATVWGLRLSVYLVYRNWGHQEDYRYRVMREARGENFWWISLVTVFMLQGVLVWFISWPLQFGISTRTGVIGPVDLAGLGLWIVGFTFETLGDFQLARFKARPENKGRVLTTGLWRYTRHPNYFGDFCVWWGFYLIAAAGGAWWTIGSPLLMSVFLMFVSGVKLLESSIVDRRPEYAQYINRTNAFFPGPPRSKGSSVG